MIKKAIVNRKDSDIDLVIWPCDKPKAILVLAHGASEHIYRYNEFAIFLNTNDVMVYGYNHLGHGSKRKNQDVYFANNNGHQLLVDDLEDVCLYAYQQHRDIPIILMGHSMGSLITRALIIDTKLLFDGIIICGTLQPKKTLVKSGKTLAAFLCKVRGKTKSSKMLNNIVFGEIEETLSFNKANVTIYQDDPNCGMLFSNGAIFDLMKIMEKIVDPHQIKKMLPTNYFIISGKHDPFSHNTADLDPFLQLMNANKFIYRYKFYDNMMHEILNEDDKQRVYDDVLDYINRRIEKKHI